MIWQVGVTKLGVDTGNLENHVVLRVDNLKLPDVLPAGRGSVGLDDVDGVAVGRDGHVVGLLEALVEPPDVDDGRGVAGCVDGQATGGVLRHGEQGGAFAGHGVHAACKM